MSPLMRFKFSCYVVVALLLANLNCGCDGTWPSVSDVVFTGHQHRFSEVRSWDCIEHGAGPAVVLRGSSGSVMAQPPCRNTKSTAAKAPPAMTGRALVIDSDAL